MKIAMVASESNPLIKSGGLADVVFSLSKELVKIGEDISVFLPFYKHIKDKKLNNIAYCDKIDVQMSWRHQGATVYFLNYFGIKYYLIENQNYFDRDNLYGYCDDGERFAFFTLAVKTLMKKLKTKFDIIHCHDWQSGMLPVIIREEENTNPLFKKTKFFMTIHNEAFQGTLDRYFVHDYYGLDDSLYDSGKLRFKDTFSTLKSGIEYSDVVTTVSPTHRDELLNPAYSFGLDSVLNFKSDKFYGILNGIDVDEFNPDKDEKIFKTYSNKTVQSGKKMNKKGLNEFFNLKNDDSPIFGLVSRLTWQKGIGLILDAAESIISRGGKICILGSGEKDLENAFNELRNRHPENVGVYIGYNDNVAHKIYAGSDFFLMPSLFEPCGLSQIISLRYGTLPIVRNVGGLKDTVVGYIDINGDDANGVAFNDFNYDGFNYAINQAFKIYGDKELYKTIRKNGLNKDYSWQKSAREYLDLYKKEAK